MKFILGYNFWFWFFVVFFQARGLSISSTYREKNQSKKRIEAKRYHKLKTEPKVTGSLWLDNCFHIHRRLNYRHTNQVSCTGGLMWSAAAQLRSPKHTHAWERLFPH